MTAGMVTVHIASSIARNLAYATEQKPETCDGFALTKNKQTATKRSPTAEGQAACTADALSAY